MQMMLFGGKKVSGTKGVYCPNMVEEIEEDRTVNKCGASFNIMEFLRLVSNRITNPSEACFVTYNNVKRFQEIIPDEEIQELKENNGLKPEIFEGFQEILKGNLSKKDYRIITLRMGLLDGECRNRWEVANLMRMKESKIKAREEVIFSRMGRIFFERRKNNLIELVNRKPIEESEIATPSIK